MVSCQLYLFVCLCCERGEITLVYSGQWAGGRAVLSVSGERDSKHTNHHLALSTLAQRRLYRVLLFTSEQGENTGLDDTHGMVGGFLDEVRECGLQCVPDTLVLRQLQQLGSQGDHVLLDPQT